MNDPTLHSLITANRHRLAVLFTDPATGRRVSMNEPAPAGLGMAGLAKLRAEPLNDGDIPELAGERLPVAYSIDRREFVVLCAHDLDAARKRRAMAAEYDQGMADSWIYLVLEGRGHGA